MKLFIFITINIPKRILNYLNIVCKISSIVDLRMKFNYYIYISLNFNLIVQFR